MNLKQLGLLLVVLAVLGGAGLVLYRSQNASWNGGGAENGGKLLGDFPVNDVAAISMAQGSNRLDLIRKDEQWTVQERQGYPANYSQIRDFLLKAQELKVVQSEAVEPPQLAALRLAPPGQGTNSALVVQFNNQAGSAIRTLLVGKQHLKDSGRAAESGADDLGWPDGRYVRVGDSKTVAVISDPLESVDPKPDAWLDKDFIRIPKAQSIEVEFPDATNSWKLARASESGEWKLDAARPGEELDSAKSSGISYPLNSPAFTDVIPGANPAAGAAGTNQPIVVKVATFDHFNYVIHVGAKTNDEYPVTLAVTADIPKQRTAGKDEKPADKAKLDKVFSDNNQVLEDKLNQEKKFENWTYLVSSWTMDPLLKERSQLLVAKKEKGSTAAADSEPPMHSTAAMEKMGSQEDHPALETIDGGTNSAPGAASP